MSTISSLASLGTGYTVVMIGKPTAPYDAELTRYLLGSYVPVVNVLVPPLPERSLAFIFFPGSEQERATTSASYPTGKDGVFSGESGRLAFYTFTVSSKR